MGFFRSRLVLSCCFLVLGSQFSALAQTASQTLSEIGKTTVLPAQEFHCHTGYPLAQCQKDILQLKKVLSHYPVERLGHWTWVLVRSWDWKPISRMLGLNPDSPAFTAIEPRETFLDEALFAHDPQRSGELMEKWHMSVPTLLEHAVTHELGHAFCDERNEALADQFGEDIRKGRPAPCRSFDLAKGNRIAAKDVPGQSQASATPPGK